MAAAHWTILAFYRRLWKSKYYIYLYIQGYFGYSRTLAVPCEFRTIFSVYVHPKWDLHRNCMECVNKSEECGPF